jgi:hypothetical protein
MNNINNQIIDDGYNSSYITSLLVALFYKSSSVDDILNMNPVDNKFIYALEFIKIRFIEPLRRGFSIHSETINEFRNYIVNCDWKNNVDEMLIEHNILEFYKFFINKIESNNIKFLRLMDDEIIGENCMSVIELSIPPNVSSMNLSDMFKLWINNNIILEKYKYKIYDIPYLLPFYINRENNKDTKINIMYKIKLFNVNDELQDKLIWTIHSMICYDKDIGYYSVIKYGSKWIHISDKNIPSINKLDMYDENDVLKLSKDIVFVFYTANNDCKLN